MTKATKQEALRRAEQSMRDKAKTKNNGKQPKSGPKQPKGSNASIGRNGEAPVTRYKERISYFSTSRSNRKNCDLMARGQDFLTAINFPAGVSTPGTLLLNGLVNPISGIFADTRIQKFGELYEKYCFTKLRFHVQSSVPTSSAGSYLLAYDRDMADLTPAPNDAGIKEYFAMEGTRSSAIWSDCSIDCPLIDTQDFYYCNYTGVDGRITTQGQVYVATLSAVPDSGFTRSLNVWVEYEVHFMIPQLQELPTSIRAEVVGPGVQIYPWSNSTDPAAVKPIGKTMLGPAINGQDSALKQVPRTISVYPTALDSVSPGRGWLDDVPTQLMLSKGVYEILYRCQTRTKYGPSSAVPDIMRFLFWTTIGQLAGSASRAPQIKPDTSFDQPFIAGAAWNGVLDTLSTVVSDANTIGGRTQIGTRTPANNDVRTQQLTSRFLVKVNDLVTPFLFLLAGEAIGTPGAQAPGIASPILTVNKVDDRAFDLL